MKKYLAGILLSATPLLLTGCGAIGEKTSSISVIYLSAAIISLVLLAAYFLSAHKKSVWYILLFASVTVVDFGYYALSVSQTLSAALMANRVAYLGSVFLPFAMLMIILNVLNVKYKKYIPILLTALGLAVFTVAASPGYWDIYYKEVSLITDNGVTVLEKVYGQWHSLYLFYLLAYFSAMIVAAVYATVKRKSYSVGTAVILNIAVFVNLGVWLIEQLVRIDFEVLSLSYIISEMFLLGLNIMLQEEEKRTQAQQISESNREERTEEPLAVTEAQRKLLLSGISHLTPTERSIFEHYIGGKSGKDVAVLMNITDNTLKYHNKNIYSKLGVSSRKQMLEIYNQIQQED